MYWVGFENNVSYIHNSCSLKLKQIVKEEVEEKEEISYIFVDHIVTAKSVYEFVNAFMKIKDSLKLTMIGLVTEQMKRDLRK